MQTSIIGYPRIGALRELKFQTEKYFRHEISEADLQETARQIRQDQWLKQKASGLDFIPSNDFSFYDGFLDTAVLFNIVPKRYQDLQVSDLDSYFAQARGYQGEAGDVKALAMKKWFNTNYHYMVAEIEDDTVVKLANSRVVDHYREAKALGVETQPSLIGPFTLLKKLRYLGQKTAQDFKADLSQAYSQLLQTLAAEGVSWVQLDEPDLVYDLSVEDIQLFQDLYQAILPKKGAVKVLLQTYFGDIRDIYQEVIALDFDGIGLDFLEGRKTLELVEKYGFPSDKLLFAGLVNGKNIWRNHYQETLDLVDRLEAQGIALVLNSSCSLLHVPYRLAPEEQLKADYKAHFAFAEEKLQELQELKHLAGSDRQAEPAYQANQALFAHRPDADDAKVQARVQGIEEALFNRQPAFAEREALQKAAFNLPLLPTTTIGSFPQTKEVKKNRSDFKKGLISREAYEDFNRQAIDDCLRRQEEIGLDVLVHGEFERNDMVEYFGERLQGYLFTQYAWVQSYGTRCVKPPIIWGDISRPQAMTVPWSTYAQSRTEHLVKGMLTGPVTILNWSFPREDISLKTSTYQIALAIRDEVLDLEAQGIRIIQIDEAALREKLPLRQTDWYSQYLDWAIPAFRLVHSGVQATTQIHTHMCYSEFTDIIPAIDQMDADVISFEASRSDLEILDSLKAQNFQTEVGPGVYDIHSPRVPSVDEIKTSIRKILDKVAIQKVWINPDCGLKTRGWEETSASLKHLVQATEEIRHENERTF
ncbi:5-methyltetrahydropteroyltriglutamate--homocysteine S-methyltransferase [Aerococcus sanguinicola]|uniref:5-methyltetrahydropteroyltriglutamate--homocysteine methyltransferase n=1 Tax=Aerococcus sanguinicola TaxID=119206 RepID=A0A0X8FB66_9LACT|nr:MULTISPECIES: 5-methyltetrahydropteroyltriglutamate--homocysteine S-methyltransferase [Aerococcus]AMB93960.1 5-methyltetrahydropteroyltriglutamate--homocysteine methyltransferase [Aerococcus sanguinicola]OFT97378.1 5-methyltetrahydropteroyltriglutamate--homocysteine S-methyltransferase [Aerococcus sp. HMSC23C02]PKZ21090.1 5-methyltetrahydropteroyltriglutamate--homocysteine S-methyltransferase [Aerococcus sanguinicola]